MKVFYQAYRDECEASDLKPFRWRDYAAEFAMMYAARTPPDLVVFSLHAVR